MSKVTLESRIVELLKERGDFGSTVSEARDVLEVQGSSLSSRFNQLTKKGKIHPTERIRIRNGKKSCVYILGPGKFTPGKELWMNVRAEDITKALPDLRMVSTDSGIIICDSRCNDMVPRTFEEVIKWAANYTRKNMRG